ncbi:serine racemase VanT catalytic subunit [Paenibacillus thiaminolyticus]|uniref:Alanine racemase n=1 Tax=Paenibacillus thiaminolyticus TaxID=49283 RepID=A0A3A3GEE1_PANTH|nr:serine racemase VanT catalytic subunit [Paenibacillus thiaminolyticus]RJG18864.1 serine racemase VanT catalytic subunit [Paenibacillus thiaminolyticus]
MTANAQCAGLDRFKIVAALLVIAIPTAPLISYSPYADFVLTGIAARVAVPFFFIMSGFLLFRKLTGEKARERGMLHRFLCRIGLLYAVSIVLYLPLNGYAGYFAEENFDVMSFLRDLVFNGTFYHLWYLPALILGTCITYFLYRTLALGAWTAARSVRIRSAAAGAGLLLLSLTLLFLEGMALHAYGWPRHDSMYVFLVPAVYAGFLLLQQTGRSGTALREMSTWIYILHPWAIVLVPGAGKLAGLTPILVGDSLVHYGAVATLSVMMSFGVVFFLRRLKRSAPDRSRRSWAEIRLDDVTHNVRELRGLLPPDCELMAVVKADAYGHGSIPVARHLSRIGGVRHFAVADVEEGVALRREGIKGEILVLGSTSPERFDDLARYRLSQTVISADYGKALDAFGKPVNVHIKIDTGMSRLGERWTDTEAIRSMYRLRNLRVTGTFTHLSCSDGPTEAVIAFTNAQIKRFGETIDEIKAAGLDPGTLHMQSSYGIVNYSELRCGMARPGIALFGLLGTERDQAQAPVDLRPALAWRATVTLVKQMQAVEPVGYGRNYKTRPGSVIATVSIGYADGVPRVLAEKGGAVLIRGHRAPIAGNICMDQLMVDVTHIEGVQEGDTVTLIGQDGQASITAGEMASRCGTITNEIVSRIGQRVDRIYL